MKEFITDIAMSAEFKMYGGFSSAECNLVVLRRILKVGKLESEYTDIFNAHQQLIGEMREDVRDHSAWIRGSFAGQFAPYVKKLRAKLFRARTLMTAIKAEDNRR